MSSSKAAGLTMQNDKQRTSGIKWHGIKLLSSTVWCPSFLVPVSKRVMSNLTGRLPNTRVIFKVVFKWKRPNLPSRTGPFCRNLASPSNPS